MEAAPTTHTSGSTCSSAEARPIPKDLAEFERLFKVPVPKQSEAAYYLSTLAQSKQYANVWESAAAFVEMEDWLVNVEQKHTKVGNYKMSTLKKIQDAITASGAHKRWSEFKPADPKLSIADRQRSFQSGHDWLLSIDLSSANFSTLLLFDDENELGGSWSGLDATLNERERSSFLQQMGVHKALAKSKQYRMQVLGHVKPRQSSQIQKMIMGYIVRHLRQTLGDQLPKDAFIFLSHDEVALQCGRGDEPDEATLKLISSIQAALTAPITIFEGKTITLGKQFKTTIYKLKAFNRKGQCVKTVFSPVVKSGASADDLTEPIVGLTENFSSLWGVPGTRFYVCFKKHILKAPFDRRDLYFFVEGHLAMWVVDSFDELVDDVQDDGGADVASEAEAEP